MALDRISFIDLIKIKIKKDHKWLYSFYRNFRFFIRTLYLKPILRKMRPNDAVSIIKMGSDHGWAIGDRSYLKNSIAISAGLGQDASFDIEFINKYNAHIVIIDPTPTSVDYFQDIVLNFGNSKEVEYVNGGAQPVNAYDLIRVNENNLKLITKALYDKVEDVKFFAPKIEGFNSRSISNIFKTEDFIVVQAVTFNKLLEELEIKSTEVIVVKLDIEGSACEVLFDFLGDSCLPKQLLIEFEEIFIFSFTNAKKLYQAFTLLNTHNYKLIHTDKIGNFTFELNTW